MAFQNPYEYHHNYAYVNNQPGQFDAESTQSQFSNFEQFNYQTNPGVRSAEHDIIGPVDQNNYNKGSYYDQDIVVGGSTQESYVIPEEHVKAHSVQNLQQAEGVVQKTNASSVYFSENSAPAIDQRTGNNVAFSVLDHTAVDDLGASPLTTRVSDSPRIQRDTHNRDNNSQLYTNQSQSSPKTVHQPGVKSNLRVVSRTTVHDRSKLAAKKSHKRSSQLPPNDAIKTESLATAAASTDQTDAFTQWYQMMSQYYSQFYPGYQLPQPPGMNNKPTGNEETKTTTKQSERSAKSQSTNQQMTTKAPAYATPPQLGYPGRPSALPATGLNNFDYAAYYYQYYYEAAAAAAAQMWSGGQLYPALDPSGRQTPKFYHTPHVRGGLATPGILLQILPNRPLDGELARIELLDLSVLANDAVAEATSRAAESGNYMGNLARFTELRLNRDQDDSRDAYSSEVSGLESPGRLSSLQAGAGDDDEEVRACAAIAVAWDRTDHVFYPGPLIRNSTLKADVLVFLRDKLAEIQDRLPIDWESAGLLISYLEFMVKNNGNIQPSDLVRLLLEGHEPQTSDLRARYSNLPSGSASYTGMAIPNNMIQSNRSYFNDSLASLPPSQAPSGRQSPQTPYGLPGAANSQGVTKAASETGGFGTTQALLRRAAAAVTASGNTRQVDEDKVLDRFRELLMHGMPMKALEHACRSQLWGHAFVLAQRIGPAVFEKVMDRFLTRAIPVSDPILTLYQLTAGELPQAVNAVAYGRGTDSGEWRPHLAMILAAESAEPELTQTALERLGDSLLSRRLVYAAHLCYLLMGPLLKQQANSGSGQPVYQLPEKIWLLGVNMTTPDSTVSGTSDGLAQPLSPLTASTEAIQLTEVYEYAMRLANPNYRLPQLLPFKLVYATRLIDAGLLDKAFRYLTAIGNELLLEASIYDSNNNGTVNPVLYSLVGNCLRLAEPLQNHPELDGFELATVTAGGRGAPRATGFTGRSSLVTSSASGPGGGGSGTLLRLRELYGRMNQQLGRAQYTSVTHPVSKPLTETVFSNEMPMTTTTATQQQQSPPQDPNSYSGPVPLEQSQRQPPLLVNSSAVEISSSATPVSASLVTGQHHSAEPQSFHHHQFGRSEAQPYSTAPASLGFATHSGDSQNTHSSAMHYPAAVSQNRSAASTNPVRHPNAPDHSGISSGPGPVYGHPPMHTTQTSDAHVPFGVFAPETHLQGPNQPTRPRQYPNPGGVGNETGSVMYHSNPAGAGVTSSPTSHDQDSATSNPTSHSFGAMHEQHAPPPAFISNSSQPNSMFFTPVPNIPIEQSSDASSVNAPGVFDYFAGLQSSEQTGSRSRTVSGCSQNSTIGAYPHARSRNSSGMGQTRRGSTGYERQNSQSSWGANGPGSHAISGQPQTPKHLAPHSRDFQQRATIKEEPRSDFIESPVHVKKEKEDSNDDEAENSSSNNAPQSKDGWFSGWLGRLKRNGSKNVHLPDDSKPSIVWDDQRKQWVDVANPDENDSPPPPPPLIVSSSLNNPGAAPIAPSGGLMSSPPSSRAGARSRYVNVLANQTAGSAAAKLDTPLQPPLPATGFRSSGSIQSTSPAPRQSFQQNDYNPRPTESAHPIDANNNNSGSNNRTHFHIDGSSSAGLMMYN